MYPGAKLRYDHKIELERAIGREAAQQAYIDSGNAFMEHVAADVSTYVLIDACMRFDGCNSHQHPERHR